MLPRLPGLRDAIHVVMIGERDEAQPDLARLRHQLGGAQQSI
jgi:hypothetical protein